MQEELPLWDWLVQQLFEWLPEIFGGVMLGVIGRLLKFPALRLELLDGGSLQDGSNIVYYYAVKVHNRGKAVARACWPRLVEVSDPQFTPQPISWGLDFAYTPPSCEPIDMQPNDVNRFVIAWTSRKESEDGILVGNITTARRAGSDHISWGFLPGTQIIKVDVVGSNFTTKGKRFRVKVAAQGAETWKTLLVTKCRKICGT